MEGNNYCWYVGVLSFILVVQLTLGNIFQFCGVDPYACDQFGVGQEKERITVPHLLYPPKSVTNLSSVHLICAGAIFYMTYPYSNAHNWS